MRLLVVKLSALGDVVQALLALGRVRPLAPPGLVIDWAVDARYAPLLRGHPWLDRLHVLDLKGWWRRGEWGAALAAWSALRDRPYGATVDLQGLVKSRLVTRAARAGLRVGYGRRADLSAWRRAAASWRRAGPAGGEGPAREAGHVVERYAGLVAAALGLPEGAAQAADPPAPLLPVGAEEASALDARLAGARVGTGEPLALVLPGGGWPTKLLPPPALAAAVAPLAAMGLRPVVLWGSEAERALAEAVAAELAAARGRLAPPVLLPRLDLRGLSALCARATIAVGGDTGPLHLAAAQGAATASFYGPTVAARSAPRGAIHRAVQAVVPCAPCFGRRCRTGRFVCLPGLDPSAITAAALAVLEARNGRSMER